MAVSEVAYMSMSMARSCAQSGQHAFYARAAHIELKGQGRH